MGPELHLQMIISRTAELREEAADHRRARQVQAAKKVRSQGERRRGFFGKFSAA
ncbi:hypothetical protein ACFV0L_43360 [Streptosporangium canum]|uniref:Uncharacterized protein n=1 Tax=Streptosporangium canum TaxID=324952 RepID=A0A1I4E690_9ACTN|nr:hypothetical protein [Streptosporangium canum]SFL01285.1 hypothetical protein SAMN05216275_14725 [Streptosporangium canum]